MKFNRKTNTRHNHPGKCEVENNLLYELRLCSGLSDPWGTCMSWRFAIADYLTPWNLVPDEWQFRQSPCGPDKESFEYQALTEYETPPLIALKLDQTLARWARMLEARGKDY